MGPNKRLGLLVCRLGVRIEGNGLPTEVWAVCSWGMLEGMRLVGRLVANAVMGLILLFVTNLFLTDDVPVNLLTLVICAVGGVLGWLAIVVLHLLGTAF